MFVSLNGKRCSWCKNIFFSGTAGVERRGLGGGLVSRKSGNSVQETPRKM